MQEKVLQEPRVQQVGLPHPAYLASLGCLQPTSNQPSIPPSTPLNAAMPLFHSERMVTTTTTTITVIYFYITTTSTSTHHHIPVLSSPSPHYLNTTSTSHRITGTSSPSHRITGTSSPSAHYHTILSQHGSTATVPHRLNRQVSKQVFPQPIGLHSLQPTARRAPASSQPPSLLPKLVASSSGSPCEWWWRPIV